MLPVIINCYQRVSMTKLLCVLTSDGTYFFFFKNKKIKTQPSLARDALSVKTRKATKDMIQFAPIICP